MKEKKEFLASLRVQVTDEAPEGALFRQHEGFQSVIGVKEEVRGGGVWFGILSDDSTDAWGFSKRELFDAAMWNTKDDFIVEKLANILMYPDKTGETVITTDDFNGAAALLFPEVLSGVAERFGGTMIILPSSTQEVICMAYDRNRIEEMLQTVKDVNSMQHLREEGTFLSDSIFGFSDGVLKEIKNAEDAP